MHIQFSTTEIGSSPFTFGWKFETNPGEDPGTDPPDNQGGGSGGTTSTSTTTTPTPEEDDAATEQES